MKPRLRRPSGLAAIAAGVAALIALGATAQSLSTPAPARRIALKAARVIPIAGPERAPGVVTIENGKILSVGAEVPPGAEIQDLGDVVLIPGLVDAHSHLGSPFDVDEDVESFDDRLRAIDVFDPTSDAVLSAARAGVTTVVFAPGEGNVIAGIASTIKMTGSLKPLRSDAGLQFTISSNATQPLRAPTSRMGLVGMLRDRLRKGGAEPRSPLARALRSETPVLIHARTPSEIGTALDLAREFNLKPIFLHVDEGFRCVAELKASRSLVACGPLTPDSPVRYLRNPGILAAAGIPVAFMSEAPLMPPGSLRSTAVLATLHGMSREAALRAITLESACIAGVADRIGTLEPGKDADLVVLSGDPLDLSAHVVATFIDGVAVYRRDAAANGGRP